MILALEVYISYFEMSAEPHLTSTVARAVCWNLQLYWSNLRIGRTPTLQGNERAGEAGIREAG